MHISHPDDANLSLVLRVWPEKMRCYYGILDVFIPFLWALVRCPALSAVRLRHWRKQARVDTARPGERCDHLISRDTDCVAE